MGAFAMGDNSNKIVFSGNRLRALCFNPTGSELIVSFDHLRERSTAGFAPPRALQFALEMGYAHLQVQTAQNDWYLNNELNDLRFALARFSAPFKAARAIGFSMGGYAALLMARELRLQQVLLVSPQISVLRNRVPWENRWSWVGDQIDSALDRLDLPKGLSGVSLFDPFGVHEDRRHAWEIASLCPQIVPVAIPFGGHPASAQLEKARLVRPLIESLVRGRSDPPTLHGLRRRMRAALPAYRASIKAARAVNFGTAALA